MSPRSEPAVALSPSHPSGRQRRPARLAGVCYVFVWVAGLLIFSASTHVRSSSAELMSIYRGHDDSSEPCWRAASVPCSYRSCNVL